MDKELLANKIFNKINDLIECRFQIHHGVAGSQQSYLQSQRNLKRELINLIGAVQDEIKESHLPKTDATSKQII